MSGTEAFKPRSLAREIRRRGLSAEQFAEHAGVGRDTIHRALRGEGLRPTTFGKILIGLANTPALDLPDDLVKSA